MNQKNLIIKLEQANQRRMIERIVNLETEIELLKSNGADKARIEKRMDQVNDFKTRVNNSKNRIKALLEGGFYETKKIKKWNVAVQN